MALDVRDRRAAGAAGVLSFAALSTSRRLPPNARASRRRAAIVPRSGKSSRPDPQDHDPGVADGNGLPGRLLRHHLLGAALPHERAQALDRRLDRLSRDADHRLLHRLSRRRLARRPDRTAQSVPDFSIGAIAVVLLYTQLPLTNEMLWVLGFPLGFFASGYFSGIGAFLTELYPTRLRGSGRASATISAAASARCFRFSSARSRRLYRSAMRSQCSQSSPTRCSSSLLSHCRRRRGRVLHAD